MSRETKIGMAVAVSFLCLVGVVVATKWRRNADPGASGGVAVVVKGNDKGSDTNPPQKPENPTGVKPAEYTPDNNPPPNKLPNNVGEGNAPVIVAPPNTPVGQEAVVSLPNQLPMVGGPPPLPMGDPLNNLGNLIAQQDTQQGLSPPPVPVALPDAINNAQKSFNEGANKVGNVADNALNKGNEFLNKGVGNVNNQLPPIQDTFNRGNDLANQKLNSAVNNANDLSNKGANAVGNKVDSILGQANNQLNKGADTLNKGLDNFNKPLPLPGQQPAETALPLPGLPNQTPQPQFTPLPSVPMVTQQTPTVPGLSTPNVEVKAPQSPTLPGIPGASNANNLPPITNSNSGGNNNFPAPAYVIPMPNRSVEVKVDDTKQYTARPGDTYASLSKAVYGDERFANALLAYNRDFSSNRNLTQPQPGQMVLFPSAQALLQQNRSADVVADLRPVGANASVSISPPVPTNPQRTFTPTTPTSDATKSYRVAATGQRMWELAIQTLGDGMRWTEIYRLNPTIDPLQPIPGNTVVRLPGNANVP